MSLLLCLQNEASSTNNCDVLIDIIPWELHTRPWMGGSQLSTHRPGVRHDWTAGTPV